MSPGGVSSSRPSSVSGCSLRRLRPWYSESGSLSAWAKGLNGEVSGGSGGLKGLNGGVQAADSWGSVPEKGTGELGSDRGFSCP